MQKFRSPGKSTRVDSDNQRIQIAGFHILIHI
jgi:hypothetical protein